MHNGLRLDLPCVYIPPTYLKTMIFIVSEKDLKHAIYNKSNIQIYFMTLTIIYDRIMTNKKYFIKQLYSLN